MFVLKYIKKCLQNFGYIMQALMFYYIAQLPV